MEASFERWGNAVPESPVVLSVPHAGRNYPAAMVPLLKVGIERLRVLEDRHADAVAALARNGRTALVQRCPRAWIDLNRAEEERDPVVDSGARPPEPQSARLRSGLGLVPRRAGTAGDIWRRRLSDLEVRERIELAHRPYHAALASLLAETRARFGTAVLLDLHSMPPLDGGIRAGTGPRTRVVIGDRFGRSAGARFAARAEDAAAAMLNHMGSGTVALNAPYAGGHVLERHGDPANGIHALQLELDRTLYLDAAFDRPGPGLEATARLVTHVLEALENEVPNCGAWRALPLAAE